MQTFLSYPDFAASAGCLDRQRLGKQRVEVLQMRRALADPSAGWRNHPAVQMWRGYEYALTVYGVIVCAEWVGRGYKDSVMLQLAEYMPNGDFELPPWLGDDRLHASHRRALSFKDWAWYSRYGWHAERPDDYTYFWPTLHLDYGGAGDGTLNTVRR